MIATREKCNYAVDEMFRAPRNIGENLTKILQISDWIQKYESKRSTNYYINSRMRMKSLLYLTIIYSVLICIFFICNIACCLFTDKPKLTTDLNEEINKDNEEKINKEV